MTGARRFAGVLGAEALAILKVRARTILGLVFLISVVATATDLFEAGGVSVAAAIGLVRLALLAALLLVLRRASSERAIVVAAVTGVTLAVAVGTLLGAARSEFSTALLISCGLCIAAGAFLPWGWRLQLVPVLTAAAGTVWLTAQFGFEVIAPQPFALTMGCLIASVYFAVDQQALQESLSRYEAGIASSYAEIDRLTTELENRSSARSESLQAATSRLEEFCESLATDLRPPLSATREELARLSSPADDQGGAEWGRLVGRIDRATLRMERTLEEMLAYVELQSVPLATEVVDLSACAERTVARLRAREPERRVDVSIDGGLVVHGDARLLEEALEQLIDNAWKFSADHDVAHIVVAAGSVKDGYREIVVRDDGVGFSMEHADKLFQPFSRFEAVEAYPGHGMGLARAHRILQRHGGTLAATAAPGEGAEFRMTLAERGVV